MRVCLVQAPRWSVHTPSYAVALLTGALRSRGFTVFPKDYDPLLYRAVSPRERELWLSESAAFWNDDRKVLGLARDHDASVDAMVEDILRHEPEVVGFSVKIWSRVFSELLAGRVKRRSPRTLVVFGGPEMGVRPPAAYLAAHPEVDAIGLREADLTFPRFLEALERDGRPAPAPGFFVRAADGTIADGGTAPPPGPGEIPFADYSDFDFSRYLEPRSLTMLMSRGCVNRCSFCSEAPSFARYRAYPAERTFAELVHHADHAPCARPLRVFFNDSLLNGRPRELERLADLLIAARERMPVEYGGMLCVRDDLSEALVDKLAASGMSEALFGLESGSPAVLARMRKPVNLDTARRVLRAFHDRGIRVVASVIFGHPGETEEEFHRSLDFLRANADSVDGFLLNYLGLFEGSDIATSPGRYGVDPAAASGAFWVGDEGRNTFELRNARVNLARLALGRKVLDIGGFSGSEGLYDPSTPYREENAGLRAELAWHRGSRVDLVRVVRLAEAPAGVSLGYLDRVERSGEGWVARGWARDPFRAEPAVEVALLNGSGRVVALCRPGHERRDVEAAFALPALRRSGFEAEVCLSRLDPGPDTLTAFVLDAATGVAWPLVGSCPVEGPPAPPATCVARPSGTG